MSDPPPEQIDAIRKMVDEGQKISRVVRIAGLSPPNGVSRVRLGEPRG